MIAHIPWLDVGLFILALGGGIFVALELCWRVEGRYEGEDG